MLSNMTTTIHASRKSPTHWLMLAERARRTSRRPGLSKRRREYGEDLAEVLERIARWKARKRPT